MDENMNTTVDTELEDMTPEELDNWVDQELNAPDSIPMDEAESIIAADAAKAEADKKKKSLIMKVAIGSVLGVGIGATTWIVLAKQMAKKKAKKAAVEQLLTIDSDDNETNETEDDDTSDNSASDVNVNIKTDKGEVVARDDARKQVAKALGVKEDIIKDMFDAGWEASVKFQSETCANDINELAKQAEKAKAPLMQQLNEMQASLSSETQRANSQASRANQAEKRAKAAEDKIKELERQLREAKKTPEQRAAEHPGRPDNPIWPKDQQPEDNGKEVDNDGVERVKVPKVEIPETKVDTIEPETIEVPETAIDSIVDDLPPVDLTKKDKKKKSKK